MPDGCQSPVAFIIFNRPEVTERVFAAIRAARPFKLFLIADGPRLNVRSDLARCATTRAVVDQIDWPCEVHRKFAASNLGLRRNVSEGLDWVFNHAEEAIILEDDCLPDPSFFRFCDELLLRYRNHPEVGVISGANLSPAAVTSGADASYHFSRYCHIWGWATWRRVWQSYDAALKEWPALDQTGWLADKVQTSSARNYWRRHFDDCFQNHADGLGTWDVQLVFALWRQNLLSIVPRRNLVANLGFGPDAVHTRHTSRTGEREATAMRFPLRHPTSVAVDAHADHQVQEEVFEGVTPWQKIYWKLRLPLPIWMVRRFLRFAAN